MERRQEGESREKQKTNTNIRFIPLMRRGGGGGPEAQVWILWTEAYLGLNVKHMLMSSVRR